MDRRRFLQLGAGVVLNPGWTLPVAAPAAGGRGWLVYVDPRLGALGERLAERIRSAADTSALVGALSGGKPAAGFSGRLEQLAYNHVILVALPDDPLLSQAWQREALIRSGAVYAFGFGNLRGSLGYVESDRNPFLHARDVPKAPFECQLISLTGSDAAGIELAVDAFLRQGLVNGIVGRAWTRGRPTLLDRDPLLWCFAVPGVIPARLGGLGRIAVSQAGEDEYRGVLADCGVLPLCLWRLKYYQAGVWDGAGAVASFYHYAVGLHRRAYGNTVWAAEFAEERVAAQVAPLIAKAAQLSAVGERWVGSLPAYAWGNADVGDGAQTGTLALWVDGRFVLMASVSSRLV